MGEYARLRGFPLFAYASLPLASILHQWWASAFPLLGFAVLALAGFGGLTRLQVAPERRHAEEIVLRTRGGALTGLPNRLALVEWLDKQFALTPATLALLRVDLDDFHDVNAALGPSNGDRVLVETAGRVRAVGEAASGFVAHVGGDGFDIRLPAGTLITAHGVAQALLKAVGAPARNRRSDPASSGGRRHLRVSSGCGRQRRHVARCRQRRAQRQAGG